MVFVLLLLKGRDRQLVGGMGEENEKESGKEKGEREWTVKKGERE